MSQASAFIPARQIALSEAEFRLLQQLFFDQVGIQLPPVKKPLLCGRLAKRLAALQMNSYKQYYNLLVTREGARELEIAIDLITTHETYFFREPQHFNYLEQKILPQVAQQADFARGDHGRVGGQQLGPECSCAVQHLQRAQAARNERALDGGEVFVEVHLKRHPGVAAEPGHALEHAVAGGFRDGNAQRGVEQPAGV